MQTEYARADNNQFSCRLTLTQDEFRAFVSIFRHSYVNEKDLSEDQEVRKMFKSPDAFYQAVGSIGAGLSEESLLLVDRENTPRINGDHFALHKLSNLTVNPTE